MKKNLTDRIEKEILADLKPVKPLAPESYFVTGFAILFAAVVTIAVIALHPLAITRMNSLQMLSVFPVLTAGVLLIIISLVKQMAPGSFYRFRPGLIPLLSLAALAGVFATVFPVQSESHYLKAGLVCLGVSTGCAIPTAALFWLLLRKGAFLGPVLSGATAGALAGLAGTFVLEMHCPNMNMLHILPWHLAAPLLGLGAGALVGHLAPSFRSR